MFRILTILAVMILPLSGEDLPSWAAPLEGASGELPAAYGEIAWSAPAISGITWIGTPPSAEHIQWMSVPGSTTLIAWTQTPGGAQIIGWVAVPRAWSAHEDWQALLDEAGVDMLPFGLHSMSPLGLKWNRIYRGDTSWLDDETYREDLVNLIIEVRQARERLEAIRARRPTRD